MNDTRQGKKDKNQHIQVFVRVRPLNNSEKNGKNTNIIEILNDKEVIVHERLQDKFSKKFRFDNVFGPSSKQIDVYNAVVNPLLEKVLAGYNCTIFAYGQTGTGKTFTMEGVNNDPTLHWQSDSSAGMIPRSLSQLFDELQLLEAQEYTVRVSFLELYNEELFDLLSVNDDASKIRLYEDASKKGAVIIHGLEEITIHRKSEVYKLLEKGSEKRQTAATLMNAHSSRSHTVFSITVHIKENTIDGEEVLKTGKLNLVDLAGSENVGRSGAVDRRAREAGSINQSLLTLGRVITALVERAPHIPYRESKLTRLLQESLGGRTKTSIIATISPANVNLEETLSTLDYAHRAQNITNRPEINQKLSKREFLKQYTEEIERLRRDLLATRERNGVYLADDNYTEMQTLITQQSKEIEEKINYIKALEKSMQDKEKIFNHLELQNIAQKSELHEVKVKLDSTTNALESTNSRLKMTEQEREEQKYLVRQHISTEQALVLEAQTLLSVADTASTDSQKLHEKIDRKSNSEQKLKTLGEQFKNNISECVKDIKDDINTYGEHINQFCTLIKNDITKQTNAQCESMNTAIHQISTNLTNRHSNESNNLSKDLCERYSDYQNWMENETKTTVRTIEGEHGSLNEVTMRLAQRIDGLLQDEIAKNLQFLRDDVSKKLKEALVYINTTLDTVCSRQLDNYDRINKNIRKIKVDMDKLSKKQEFTEKQRAFAKMMEDVSRQFSILRQGEEQHYSMVTNKCNYVGGICDNMNDQSANRSDEGIKMKNSLKEQVENDLKKIESDIITETKKNEELTKTTTQQEKVLVNELKSSINASCDILQQYKNLAECNSKEMKEKMDVDRNGALSVIDDGHKTIVDLSKSHEKFMVDQKAKASDISETISKKLENRIVDSTEWSNKVIEQLYATVHEVNKYFDEDLQSDVPTGQTPARREFNYPRQFTVTSPHERILQRFREARNFVETSVDDDDTYISDDIAMKGITNSTAIYDVNLMSSTNDNTIHAESAINSDICLKNLNSYNLTNSQLENITSTLDISSISVQSRTLSETDVDIGDENKENNNCNFETQKCKKYTITKNTGTEAGSTRKTQLTFHKY